MIGTYDIQSVNKAIDSIAFHTKLFKKRRVSVDKLIELIYEDIELLKKRRDYQKYLKNIGH